MENFQYGNFNFNFIFSIFFDKSNTFLSHIYMPLIIVQLLVIHHINIILIAIFLISFLAIYRWRLISIITQTLLLIYLSLNHDNENFWLISLAFLIALNHYLVPALASHYFVPKQELLMVTLIFQNVFLVNALF